MPDIDLQRPLAQFENFADLSAPLQEKLVIDVRKKIIEMIYQQHEKVLGQAIPKALEAGLGIAFKGELESGPAHPLWDARSYLVTHTVKFYLSDVPPPANSGFQWIPPDAVKQLWGARPVAQPPRNG